MNVATIITRPGIRHSAVRELRELCTLRAELKRSPTERRPRLARRIAEHVAHLEALDELAELFAAAADEMWRC